jgi:cholesterol transport system auxiliary component
MAETSSWLDSSAVGYRLNYARSNQPMVYANSHWTMPPAELITRRIRSQLATQTNVIATTDSLKDPVLQVEVEEFTQIFDTPEQSHAIVRLRATVVRDGRVLDQRTFWVEAPAPTPDAAGGVAALTSASNNAISELAAWAGGVLR